MIPGRRHGPGQPLEIGVGITDRKDFFRARDLGHPGIFQPVAGISGDRRARERQQCETATRML